MFCVIYEFEVDSKNEAEFKKIWHELTLLIRKSGGLGARLHKDPTKQNIWLAYSQWANKSDWEAFSPVDVTQHEELTKRMKQILENVLIPYQLELVDDLLDFTSSHPL